MTIDDISSLDRVAACLDALPRRIAVRIVFDREMKAASYADAVATLAPRADILGEILDSSEVAHVSVAEYVRRTERYLEAFGDQVAIWEIGNEVNGEWLGRTSDVVAKVAAAYDVVAAAGKATALTTYYNPDCWERADHEMLPWLAANIPARLKSGLDYVLVSYYEPDCNDYRPPTWTPLFDALRTMFPQAALGFGEVGLADPVTAATRDEAAALMDYYYALRPDVPGFIGGYFWWNGEADVLAGSSLLLEDFRRILAAG